MAMFPIYLILATLSLTVIIYFLIVKSLIKECDTTEIEEYKPGDGMEE